MDAVHHLVEALDDALEVELLLALRRRPPRAPPPRPAARAARTPSTIIAHSSRQVSRFERYETWQICSIVARPFTCATSSCSSSLSSSLSSASWCPGRHRAPSRGRRRCRGRSRATSACAACPPGSAPRSQVERDHVVLAGLGHHELVLARGPGEHVEQDLLDVVLDRARSGPRARARRARSGSCRACGPGAISRLASRYWRTLILPRSSRSSPSRSSGIAAAGVDDPPHVQVDVLRDVALAERQHARSRRCPAPTSAARAPRCPRCCRAA